MSQRGKIAALGAAILGSLGVGSIVWALGGPGEAYATARIDGFEVVPIMPMFGGTCYPSGFTNAKYREVAVGDTPDAVRAKLGEPLRVLWQLDDEVMGGRFVWFQPAADGQLRSFYVHDMPVPNGTSMSSLAALHLCVVEEMWDYSRSCVPDDSKRVRWVSFRGGRIIKRGAGIYYD